MTDTSKDIAWIEDACDLFDREAQDLGFPSHVYSTRLRALRAELDEAKVEVERLRNAMQWALDTVTIEINPSNYDHDDVCRLNAEMIEAVLGLQTALKGTSDD